MHRGSPRTIIRALSGELELEGCNMVQMGCVVSSSSSVRVVVTRALRVGVGPESASAWSLRVRDSADMVFFPWGVAAVVAMEFSEGLCRGGGRCGLFV
ncbi:hypothetical protein LOK49_LG03G03261 [Camellia lanceoleosa]|uniref:Uncharacterized protein n=1 Tax=Camellia lanceoleosa TaxID=1840588 RepID=A0ACC0IE42_9ERIC|nr:hypothetical protein LOK49_LG03G03261 [Camellia lanceoleosa]